MDGLARRNDGAGQDTRELNEGRCQLLKEVVPGCMLRVFWDPESRAAIALQKSAAEARARAEIAGFNRSCRFRITKVSISKATFTAEGSKARASALT